MDGDALASGLLPYRLVGVPPFYTVLARGIIDRQGGVPLYARRDDHKCVYASQRETVRGGGGKCTAHPSDGGCIYIVNMYMVRSRVQELFTCTNASGMDWSKPNRTVSHWA